MKRWLAKVLRTTADRLDPPMTRLRSTDKGMRIEMLIGDVCTGIAAITDQRPVLPAATLTTPGQRFGAGRS